MDFEEQAQRLRTHVEQLASDIGERNVFRPTSLQAAASYVEHEWEHQGYAVERLAYDVSGVRCLNLEITHSGGARDREILLIGAHYDTVSGSPGANDNASGVSVLLEISRLFASIEPALTVRFVAFVNEEPPFFMTRQQGSTVYAEAARRRGDDIRLMASIETIGWYSSEPGSQSYPPLFNLFYPNRADFIEFSFAGGNAAACGGVSCKFGFPARDRGDVLVYSRSLLERSSVVLAPGLSRRHDHGYGIPSVSILSRTE
jgi:Peptidase family M28